MEHIHTMDYGTIATNKGMKGSGLMAGDIILVIGDKVLPVKRSDPYLQRVYVLCVKVTKEGFHEIPNNSVGEGDNGYRTYLIDPRNITKLVEDDQEALRKKLELQYSTDSAVLKSEI